MSDNQPEYKMVNVQMPEDVREMLGILKKRYGLTKMGDALREYFRETDAELVTAGQMLVRVQSRAVGSGSGESSGDEE